MFDPETPLILSSEVKASLALPLADMSAESHLKTGRLKLLRNVSRDDIENAKPPGTNYEFLINRFDDAIEVHDFVFSQPVNAVFVLAIGIGGPIATHWISTETGAILLSMPDKDSTMWIKRTATTFRFTTSGAYGAIWVWVNGFY